MFGHQPRYRHPDGMIEVDSVPWWAKLCGMVSPGYRQQPFMRDEDSAPTPTPTPTPSPAPRLDPRPATNPAADRNG